MWRKVALFIGLVLCARAQNGISNAISGPWTAELNGTWRWHVGDDPQWAAPLFDDADWSVLRVPGPMPLERHYWIRLRVQTGPISDPGVLLGPIAYAYEVYWDGQRIGSFGDLSRGIWFVPRWQTFHVPRELAGVGGREIAIRVGQIGTFSGGRPLHLDAGDNRVGDFAALQDAESADMRADFQPQLLQLLVEFALFLAGLYFLLLPPSISQGAAFRWLGLILLGRALGVMCAFYADDGPIGMPGAVPLALTWTCGSLSLIASIEFPYALFRRRVPLALRCFECFLAVLAAPVPFSYSSYFVRFNAFLIPAAVPIALAATEVRKRTAGAGLTLFLFAIYGAATLDNVLVLAYRIQLPTAFFIAGYRLWVWDAALFLWMPAITMQVHKTNLRFRDEQQRLSGEMTAARQVQELLLPSQSIHVPGFEIDASYHPATEVGGDFFQIFPVLDSSLLLIVGDVSGKGMKAALLVSLIVGALQNRKSNAPAALLGELNGVLLGRSEGGFTTCCCALFAADGTVTLANAGHLAPYCTGAEVATLPGVPLGLTPDAEWEEMQVKLQPGDRLLWISDGVIEARNGKRELLGFERARELSGRPAAEICCVAQAFGQEDDITVISITRQKVAAYVA